MAHFTWTKETLFSRVKELEEIAFRSVDDDTQEFNTAMEETEELTKVAKFMGWI